MRWLIALLILPLPGCAIAARSDKFGAEIDVGVGGLLAYIADLRLKASIGFSKTCPNGEEADDGKKEEAVDSDPWGLRGFL